MERPIIVIGSGIAGLSVARNLQRFGCRVILIDLLPSPGGASFGNGGFISPDTVVPIAMPGMLRKIPRWMLDPLGPLTIRPTYAPCALPWLLRWVRAGRMKAVGSISPSLRALHNSAIEEWRSLLGKDLFAKFIRQNGHLHLWDTHTESRSDIVERNLQDSFGVERHLLDQNDVRKMVPGISDEVKRGAFLPRNGYTVSPAQVNAALADAIHRDGGQFHLERVLKIIPETRGGWTVMTSSTNHRAEKIVVACGAWSRDLLAPLGVKVPLETERGYRVILPNPSVDLTLPIAHRSRSIVVTPMLEGLNIAGTVEIAGLHAAPDERRAAVLVEHARRLFPHITSDEPRIWMGHRPSLPDSLPVLGPVPRHQGLYVCFGHGHFGMTGSPASGRVVGEMIVGKQPFIDPTPYSISRFSDSSSLSLGSGAIASR